MNYRKSLDSDVLMQPRLGGLHTYHKDTGFPFLSPKACGAPVMYPCGLEKIQNAKNWRFCEEETKPPPKKIDSRLRRVVGVKKVDSESKTQFVPKEEVK